MRSCRSVICHLNDPGAIYQSCDTKAIVRYMTDHDDPGRGTIAFVRGIYRTIAFVIRHVSIVRYIPRRPLGEEVVPSHRTAPPLPPTETTRGWKPQFREFGDGIRLFEFGDCIAQRTRGVGRVECVVAMG